MNTRGFAIALYMVCICAALPAQEIKLDAKELSPLLALADKAEIRERIIFLSDDRLKGRLPGTPGYQMAVDFVVGQLTKLGVKPKGDQGYLQKVTLRTGVIDTTRSTLMIVNSSGEKKLRYGKDYAFVPDLNKVAAQAESGVVFAGFGVTAPHLNHDDYKGLDVKGKIVVIQEGVPSDFPAGERAHFNLLVTKCEAANAQGAAGLIVLISANAAGTEESRVNILGHTSMDGITGYLNPDGKAFSSRTNTFEKLKFLGYAKASLFEDSKRENGRYMDLKISGSSYTKTINQVSENIVGVIPGTDPNLKNEYVVHTAHLDHVGIGAPVKGDSIYNGAHDNASGTACLLEISKLYTKAKLKRSILIVFVTSEEKGLLGSGFFAANPTVPKRSIVADVNTDMPTLIAPLLSIEPLGAEHSSLFNEVQRAAAYLNLDVMPDHMPEQVRFVRSDQYSFIRQGIPALHVKYGLKTNDPGFDLKKKIDEWTAEHYHKPSDEFSDDAFNFDAAVTYVKLNFLIGWQVANETIRPSWNKGDFFGDTFGSK